MAQVSTHNALLIVAVSISLILLAIFLTWAVYVTLPKQTLRMGNLLRLKRHREDEEDTALPQNAAGGTHDRALNDNTRAAEPTTDPHNKARPSMPFPPRQGSIFSLKHTPSSESGNDHSANSSRSNSDDVRIPNGKRRRSLEKTAHWLRGKQNSFSKARRGKAQDKQQEAQTNGNPAIGKPILDPDTEERLLRKYIHRTPHERPPSLMPPRQPTTYFQEKSGMLSSIPESEMITPGITPGYTPGATPGNPTEDDLGSEEQKRTSDMSIFQKHPGISTMS